MTEYFELPEVPEYISTDQAAKILRISKQRVYQFIEEKRLPAFRASHPEVDGVIGGRTQVYRLAVFKMNS